MKQWNMTKPNLFPALLVALSFGCAAQPLIFPNNSLLDSLQSITDSTSPSNGDLNPYGVAFVPSGFPTGANIAPGDVLVSNFNNNMGTQGTGTTIISMSPTGTQSLFATSTQIGLTTALGCLQRGFVLVGNLPNNSGTIGAGMLQVFDHNGKLVTAFADATLLDGPWDLTINDQGSTAQVFVSNVLNGTVTRLNLAVTTTGVSLMSKTQIGSEYAHGTNSAALVVGPTGLAYDPNRDILYVASTDDNKVFGIENAGSRTGSDGTGFVVFADQKVLHGPLALTLSPNGNLITANGDAVFAGGTQNDLVEFTENGILVATYQLDGGLAGAAFGIASTSSQGTVRFAAVDDNLNTVTIWTLHPLIL
jgi:hypothetical protein